MLASPSSSPYREAGMHHPPLVVIDSARHPLPRYFFACPQVDRKKDLYLYFKSGIIRALSWSMAITSLFWERDK